MKIQNVITAVIGSAALSASIYFALPATASPCVTSSTSGVCGPYTDSAIFTNNGGAEVVQNVWNPQPSASQTLTANGPDSWNVSATMPAGNHAVISYPDVRVDYTPGDQPTAFTALPNPLTSGWSQADPSGTGQDYEWAYDIWLGATGRTSWISDQEIMIWTDNHGQVPGGSDTGHAYTDSLGTSWKVWARPGSNSVSQSFGTITFVRTTNASTGSVDLQGFFAYLTANGYTNPGAGVDQVGYGAELCSTGGATLDYAVTGYSLGGVVAPPTSPPPSIVPGGLSQTAHVTVNFGWQAPVGWTGGYEFQVFDSAGQTVDDQVVSTTHVGSVSVKPDTTYGWRVRMTGATWSAIRSFTSP